jgi:GMP synthase-like glutamine amidotransferase
MNTWLLPSLTAIPCLSMPPTRMQLIVHQLGGEVKTAEGGGEYGRMPMTVVRESTLFGGEPSDSQLVWMSHGDEAVKPPEGFGVVARSEQGAIVAIENPARRIFGLQYHPEVVHRWVLDCGGSWRLLCSGDLAC